MSAVAWVHAIWRGETIAARVVRSALLPASWVFGAIVARRNARFDAATLRRAALPSLSIGNLTVGGSGKTPLTVHVVQTLQARGLRVGVVSRSGTLTYEAVAQLTELGIGQSSAVGIGGDPINGLKHIDVMRLFNEDPNTDAVIMIGEIGGPDEAEAARWCKAHMKKPVVGFIAGVTAPPGKRMGHAGALISGGADTAEAKLAVMEECGFIVTRNPSEMGKLLKKAIGA